MVCHEFSICVCNTGQSWWRSIVVRPPVQAVELSLSCARLTAGRVTPPGSLMSSNPLMMGYEGGELLLAGAGATCDRLLAHCVGLCSQAVCSDLKTA